MRPRTRDVGPQDVGPRTRDPGSGTRDIGPTTWHPEPRTWAPGPKTWHPGTKTEDPRPGIWDPRPETQGPCPRTWDLGLKTQDSRPRTQDFKIWDPRTLNSFIELQNKTLKSKKSLTSKCDNAKYPFTYFSLMTIGFFSRVKVCFLNFLKDSGYPWFLFKYL